MAVPSIKDLHSHREEIVRIAANRGARNVRVFGSVARGDARDESDVDLLADFEPGRSLIDMAGLEHDLSELLGCEVHITELLKSPRAPRDVHFRERVVKEAVPL